ncbi:MAG: response regulator [Candidatus Heimdallarchaeota archaeon]|nr:response regulator [Candidatus Heimdallarchaeota archaeon]
MDKYLDFLNIKEMSGFLPDLLFKIHQNGEILDYKILSNISNFPVEVNLINSNIFLLFETYIVDKIKSAIEYCQALDMTAIYDQSDQNYNTNKIFKMIIKRTDDDNYFLAVFTKDKIDDKQTDIEFLTRLFEARNLQAIGRLAGGVAHDFNNILTTINLNVDYLKNEFNDRHQMEILEEMVNSVFRGKELVDQLLALSRTKPLEKEIFDFSKVYTNLLKLVKRTFEKNIMIKRSYKVNRMFIQGNYSMIYNAILNILINAKDSIEIEGTINFLVSEVEFDETQLIENKLNLQVGKYIKITIEDTGVGIEPTQLDKIFEPFFTNKSIKSGTGLGLSIAYGSIKSHNGDISVESKLKEGTSFSVYLPITDATVNDENGDNIPIFNNQIIKILAVDDDDNQLLAMKRLLERKKYKVTVISKPELAISYFDTQKHEVNLLILDVEMPEMNGWDLFINLLNIKSTIQCIFVSGHMFSHSKLDLTHPNVLGFLKKPYRTEQLLDLITTI